MRGEFRWLIIFTSLFIFLAGCRNSEQQESVTITVSYYSTQEFHKMFGYAFEAKFPHINVQVVPYDVAQNENTHTDVVYINGMDAYKKAIANNKLKSLTALANGKPLMEDISPVVLTLLSAASPDGQVYALTPTFHSEALYFNKDIFDQYNVDYPYNGMSWRDVFMLALQFPNENSEGERLYGLQMNFYKDVTLNYILKAGEAKQLSYIDPISLKISMNTEEWKEIWEFAIEAFRAGVIYDMDEDMESFQDPAFFTQDAAMTIGSHQVAYNFKHFSNFEGGTNINWGMVTAPIDPSNPDYSNAYDIYDFFGVSSATQHETEAAELVKFIAGDPLNSRLIAQERPNYGLPAVTDYIQPIGDHDLTPLHSLRAVPSQIDPYLVINHEIIDAFKKAAQSILDKVIKGYISIDEALAEVELKGQQAVDHAVLKLDK